MSADNKLVNVDVDVNGVGVTRHGVYTIGKLTAIKIEDKVTVGFVSKDLHRALNAGCTIDATDLDKFCKAWLRVRQVPYGGVDLVSKQVLDHLKEAETRIKLVKQTLKGKS